MAEQTDEILFERHGALGLVTLNRPKALNALSLPMIRGMHAQLDAWEADPAVTRVAVRGAGGRAFCAGGDIRYIYQCGKAGRFDDVFAFWSAEYALIARVQRFSKPYVSLIEGVVMGGGAGLSLHGPVRVASEGYDFAMPEVGIGLFPDVGMTYALPRLPGRVGTYLALTGARVGPGDALAVGLATHGSPAATFPAIIDALAEGGPVEAALGEGGAAPPTGPLVAQRALIDACFYGETVADILARLDADVSPFAAETAALIRTRSPSSLCIAREQMRRGPGLDFSEAVLTEYRIVTRVMRGHDFFEGVRAVIVDKDGTPHWRPETLAEVDHAAILSAFEPVDGPESRFT
ncbi:enoyl-CoA hydratase/isomerase family protein [Methylobacterium trifolii]|uniref:3-hydroxyisobutyryl-CoA hydrolase n=1 Tax=Methylobacterium trifolii TaxID=1003092 RepID=A0ABQ4U056_9HYPH|nr:Carnitinyl-CoA dehydratase [Methylobacterium trifolii]